MESLPLCTKLPAAISAIESVVGLDAKFNWGGKSKARFVNMASTLSEKRQPTEAIKLNPQAGDEKASERYTGVVKTVNTRKISGHTAIYGDGRSVEYNVMVQEC